MDDRLTREQIEQWREALSRTYGQSGAPEMIEAVKAVNALCDLAALRQDSSGGESCVTDPERGTRLVGPHGGLKESLPNPTDADLADSLFEAIWQATKTWDVNAPEYYKGYCGMNGSHVMLILNAIRPLAAPQESRSEVQRYHQALSEAAYTLFQVKRLVDAGPITRDFVRAAYDKACSVLDIEPLGASRAESCGHTCVWYADEVGCHVCGKEMPVKGGDCHATVQVRRAEVTGAAHPNNAADHAAGQMGNASTPMLDSRGQNNGPLPTPASAAPEPLKEKVARLYDEGLNKFYSDIDEAHARGLAEGLEMGAKVCEECRVLIVGDPTAKQGAVMIARETGRDLARQIRAKIKPAKGEL